MRGRTKTLRGRGKWRVNRQTITQRNKNNQVNNNTNKIKNINKKINNLNNKLNNNLFKIIPDKANYIINDNNYKLGNLTKMVHQDHQKRLLEYMTDVLDPEFAVTSNHQVKQPNLFPIPSSSVGYKDEYTLATDPNGNFRFAWNPSYLVNKQYFDDLLLENENNVAVQVNSYGKLVQLRTGNPNYFEFHKSYIPDVSFSKYRLVSAKVKVTYIGSNLNKSGVLMACATYDQTPVAIGHTPNNATAFAFYDGTTGQLPDFSQPPVDGINQFSYKSVRNPYRETYQNLDKQRIINGIWNKTVNVVQTNQGISCTFIPSDPTNEIFYPTGEYFGFDYRDPSNYESPNFYLKCGPLTSANSFAIPFTTVVSDVGSQLCFLVYGYGLPVNSYCINVQCFYNYEIIPTLSSAPFLKSSILSNEFNAREINMISNNIKNNISKLAIRAGNNNNITAKPNFLSKITKYGNYFKKIMSVINAVASSL